MKYLQNITSEKRFNDYRPLVAYDAEEDKVYYLPFENMPPFTITAVSDITVSMSRNVIQYSWDGIQWQDLPVGNSFSASAGDTVYIRCSSPSVSSSGMGTFSIEGTFSVAGNIMALVNGANYNTDYTHKSDQFYMLFWKNKGLLDASELILPATALEERCYQRMFEDCTSLVNAPKKLPATTLAESCYNRMFYGCTSLVTAPELPATELDTRCYQAMFEGCTSLVNAPTLPATTLVQYCYVAMFQGCSKLSYVKAMFLTTPSSAFNSGWVKMVSDTGVFVKNIKATWNVVGDTSIPEGWTVETAAA